VIGEFDKLRKLREKWIENQVRRTVGMKGVYRFYWQSPLLVLLKSIAAAILILLLFSLHVYVGDGLEAGFQFFKLEKIFKLQFPGTEFFHKVSFLLFAVIVGIPSLLFFRDQLSGLLSSVVLNRSGGRLYYRENRIIHIKTVTIPFDQIETVSLKQNFITGMLLKTGTIEIATKSGDRYVISSIGNAHSLALQLSS
jgi:hypothetical protein